MDMKANSGIARQFRSIVVPLLEFVYPSACLSCVCALPHDQKHVCRVCWDSMARLSQLDPLFEETKGKLCLDGKVDMLESVYVFDERGVIRSLVHALKYQGRASVGIMLGVEVGDKMIQEGIGGDFLVPVPLHRIKERERGYNQAELIGSGISQATGIPCLARVVSRRKHTETQTLLSIEERKRNMEDAFVVRQKLASEVRGATCILVDDVITTGSTILACASVLKEAGARRVIAASIALAKR